MRIQARIMRMKPEMVRVVAGQFAQQPQQYAATPSVGGEGLIGGSGGQGGGAARDGGTRERHSTRAQMWNSETAPQRRFKAKMAK